MLNIDEYIQNEIKKENRGTNRIFVKSQNELYIRELKIIDIVSLPKIFFEITRQKHISNNEFRILNF